jgi:hypothetical protein
MSFIPDNGLVDNTGRVNVFDFATWEDVPETWQDFSTWFIDPQNTLTVGLPVIDLGAVQTVNLRTTINARGTVSYRIFYSNDSVPTVDPLNFNVIDITNAQTNIPSITARYIWVCIIMTYDSTVGFQYFDSIDYAVGETYKTISFANINSATLAGTSAQRTFVLPDSGGIGSVQVTAHNSASYDVDMYVYHSTTSTTANAKILEKRAGEVDIAFIGVDGRPRDAVFDIELQVLPEWYMDSLGNLLER